MRAAGADRALAPAHRFLDGWRRRHAGVRPRRRRSRSAARHRRLPRRDDGTLAWPLRPWSWSCSRPSRGSSPSDRLSGAAGDQPWRSASALVLARRRTPLRRWGPVPRQRGGLTAALKAFGIIDAPPLPGGTRFDDARPPRRAAGRDGVSVIRARRDVPGSGWTCVPAVVALTFPTRCPSTPRRGPGLVEPSAGRIAVESGRDRDRRARARRRPLAGRRRLGPRNRPRSGASPTISASQLARRCRHRRGARRRRAG